jgi:hypothetical protein
MADTVKPTNGWLPGLAALRQMVEDIQRAIPRIPELPKLPPTTFRCARCGHDVGGFTPRSDGPNFRTNFHCPEHGALEDPDDRWHAEWTRRGKPRHLTLRLPPVQSRP